jgi:YbbR domain-containing protein
MKWLFNNWPQKIGSLLLAILLWQLVVRIEEPTLRSTFNNITIDYRNRPQDLAITKGPTTVTVEVSALGSELPRVKAEDVTAWVDLSKADASTSSYRVHVTVPNEVLSKAKVVPRPEFVAVTLQKVVSKVLKLSPPQYVGTSERYVLGNDYKFTPEEVVISGPQASVMRARTAQITVDIGKLEPGVAYERPVSILDEDGLAVVGLSISPSKVTFSPSLAPTPQEKNLLISPVWNGSPAPGFRVIKYELIPNQIKVSGDAKLLAGTYTLDTAPIDINGISETTQYQTAVVMPRGLTAKQRTVTVRVFVERNPIAPAGG